MIFNICKFYELITIICIFLLMEGFSEQLSSELNEDLSTEIIAFDEHTLQLKVRWQLNITNETTLDIVAIPHKMENCSHRSCMAYGISKKLEEINLPRDPMSNIEHKECSIELGCRYTVEVSNRRFSKNITIEIPNCFGELCSCSHSTILPETRVTAEVLSTNLINVSWHIDPQNLMKSKSSFSDIELTYIYISIRQQKNPSLTWGGPHTKVADKHFPINFTTKYNSTQVINGHSTFNTLSSMLPGSQYYIRAHVVDKINCRGPESYFNLIVPTVKNESRQGSDSDHSQIYAIIIPIALLIFIGICVAHYIFKNVRKENPANNWRSIYHQTPSSSVRPISMEENFLYTDKDILEAQEKGKADVFEVPQNSITIGYEIGKGAFGRVFKANAQNIFRIPGSMIVAVKQLKKRPTADEVEEFLGEISTMKNVGRHENVVALLGCCTIKEPLMMIMEYVGQGDLLQYLRNVRKKHMEMHGRHELIESSDSFLMNPLLAPQGRYLDLRLSSTSGTSEGSYITQPDMNATVLRPSVTETMYTMLSQSSNLSNCSKTLDYVVDNKELHNFAIQIAKGMRHLEEKGITHRDLAARNILIDERKILKISDFGLSRNGIYVNTRNKKLPLRWLSIEAIRDNLYSSKSDVWAFAIVLWEIGTLGGFPYPTISNHELLSFLSSGQRLERPEICTETLYKLMLNCWEENSEKRPSFNEIFKLLQPQSQTKIYVDFNSLGSDYVFPPTKEQVFENNHKAQLQSN